MTPGRTYILIPESAGQCRLWSSILGMHVDDIEICNYETPDPRFLSIGIYKPGVLGVLLSPKICVVYFSVELSGFVGKNVHKSNCYNISMHALKSDGSIFSWDLQRSYNEFDKFRKALSKVDSTLFSMLVDSKLPRALRIKASEEEIEKHLGDCENFFMGILAIPGYRNSEVTKDFFYLDAAKAGRLSIGGKKSKQRASTISSGRSSRGRRAMSVAENL